MEFIRIANFISIKTDPKKILEELIYIDNNITIKEMNIPSTEKILIWNKIKSPDSKERTGCI